MNICKSLTTMTFVSSQNWRKVTLIWIPDLVQSPTNENPGINLENGLLSEQSKNNSRKSSPLTAQYLRVKDPWVPLCFINFEDILIFPNFDIASDEEVAWLCNVQQSFSTYDKDTEYPGWIRYHSHFNHAPKQPLGINNILPLIPEKVNPL